MKKLTSAQLDSIMDTLAMMNRKATFICSECEEIRCVIEEINSLIAEAAGITPSETYGKDN
jgi:hypothetical protein